MEPVTMLLLALGASYGVVGPDRVTYAATRGVVGGVRSGWDVARPGVLDAVDRWAAEAPRGSWTGAAVRSARKTAASPSTSRSTKLGPVARPARGTRSGGPTVGSAIAAGIRAVPASTWTAARQASHDHKESMRRRRALRERRASQEIREDENTNETRNETRGPAMAGNMVGELADVAQLEAEAKKAFTDLAEAYETVGEVMRWVDSLPERYEAALFSTVGLDSAVTAMAEHPEVVKAVDAVLESFELLGRACKEAAVLGDLAATVKASGSVAAFQEA